MGCTARIIDPIAQGDVGKEFAISVDLLNCKDHSLHPTESAEVESGKRRECTCNTVCLRFEPIGF